MLGLATAVSIAVVGWGLQKPDSFVELTVVTPKVKLVLAAPDKGQTGAADREREMRQLLAEQLRVRSLEWTGIRWVSDPRGDAVAAAGRISAVPRDPSKPLLVGTDVEVAGRLALTLEWSRGDTGRGEIGVGGDHVAIRILKLGTGDSRFVARIGNWSSVPELSSDGVTLPSQWSAQSDDEASGREGFAITGIPTHDAEFVLEPVRDRRPAWRLDWIDPSDGKSTRMQLLEGAPGTRPLIVGDRVALWRRDETAIWPVEILRKDLRVETIELIDYDKYDEPYGWIESGRIAFPDGESDPVELGSGSIIDLALRPGVDLVLRRCEASSEGLVVTVAGVVSSLEIGSAAGMERDVRPTRIETWYSQQALVWFAPMAAWIVLTAFTSMLGLAAPESAPATEVRLDS